jgi:hypothetical protein
VKKERLKDGAGFIKADLGLPAAIPTYEPQGVKPSKYNDRLKDDGALMNTC